MSLLAELILTHYTAHPLMQVQDAVKLIYQNEFAGGHLISNSQTSYDYLCKEYTDTTIPCIDRFEEIGNNLCRINLAQIKDEGITLDTLNHFFVYTSNQKHGSISGFEQKLATLLELCQQNMLPFSSTEVTQYLKTYKSKGYPPVSHSETYRQAYSPHYRVVDIRFKHYYPLLCQIERLLKSNKTITLAIDGNSGSGKSSLASLLKAIYDCNVFHMDDFFLSSEQKTLERLGEAGGNVDYVRFKNEVMTPLMQDIPFDYQIFDCKCGKLADWIHVSPKPLNIIEGVYSLHPTYDFCYNVKVFLYTNPVIQSERILHRNGEYMLQRFQKEWIPLENHYFSQLKIVDKCDYVIDTSCH